MSLWIIENEHSQRVIDDLKRICPDPGLQIDTLNWFVAGSFTKRGSGQVTLTSRVSSVGCELLKQLTDPANPVSVHIQGGTADQIILIGGRQPQQFRLSEKMGVTFLSSSPQIGPAPTVKVIYDVTACANLGYWAESGSEKITTPSRVILFHELSHALDLNASESTIIRQENAYRTSLGQKLLRTGIGGGCGAASSGTTGGKNCFIATAAYGSELAPNVEFLRRFRDDVLRKTRSGAAFFDRFYEHYYRVSPIIVQLMRQDPQVRELVRWSVVTPIVQHLELLLRFPDAPLEGVEEPWRSFLSDVRDSLERWVETIELPYDFSGLSAHAAANEIEIAMRYLLRRCDTRTAYLQRLQELSQIPLITTVDEREEIFESLRSSGRSENEISQILGVLSSDSCLRHGHSLRVRTFVGTDHVIDVSTSPPPDWIYTVTIRNATTDRFDEIDVFYERTDVPGVILLRELNVGPSEIRVFRLGICNKMKSYVVGCFLGNQMVARIPAPGQNMTPQLASSLNPSDTEPCADSWQIQSRLGLSQSTYNVTIKNSTPDTWDEIALSYAPKSLPGQSRTFQATAIDPGQIRTFQLGPCLDMDRYLFTIWISGVIEGVKFPKDIPAAGGAESMTPALASLVNWTDTDPCADFWDIVVD